MAEVEGCLCEPSPSKRVKLDTETTNSDSESNVDCDRSDDRSLRRDLRVKRHLCKKSSSAEPNRGRRIQTDPCEAVSSTSDFLNPEVTADSTKNDEILPADCVSAIVESLAAVVSEEHDRALGTITESDCSELAKGLKQKENEDDPAEDNEDDIASTISNVSGLSDLSDVSGLDWKPMSSQFLWAQHQIELGVSPRNLMQELVPLGTVIPPHLDDVSLWRIACSILCEPPQRKKLNNINTLDDVVRLLRVSKKIIVLTGAGVSVSSGIPDFRSRDGIYARLAKDFPDLPDPQAMFDIHYFRKDPRPFFKFAREIYPGQFAPSLSHHFIKLLEDHGKLLRNYSQNIDTLEQIAGIKNVIQCHGSFATATCTTCGHKTDSSAIKDKVFQQHIPKCPVCWTPDDHQVDDCWQSRSVMKPDIVFFGEGLPEEFHSTMAEDKEECDLLIVIGSSLKVRPVALIPCSLPWDVPQILINREPLPHFTFDVELLGDCDVIINEICLRLKDGWDHIASNERLREVAKTPVDDGNIYILPDGCDIDESVQSSQDRNLDDNEKMRAPDSTSCDQCVKSESTEDKVDSTHCHSSDGGCYYFISPNRYEFSGAEVHPQSSTAPSLHPLGSQAAKFPTRRHQSLSDSDDSSSSGESTAEEFDGGAGTSTEFDERAGSCASGEDSGVGDVRCLPQKCVTECRTVDDWSKVDT